MPATKRLVVDLPEHTVSAIEAQVASGEYADASEAVAAALKAVATLEAQALPPGVSGAEWAAFARSCRETLGRIDSGLEPTYSASEVREELARRRVARTAAE